jgi:hypothetical protein
MKKPLKLTDIVKEIANNKDEFLQVKETLSNPELSKIRIFYTMLHLNLPRFYGFRF